MATQAKTMGNNVVDFLKGSELADAMIEAGASKAELSSANVFLRGIMGGAFLAIATSISFYAAAQTGLPIVGAVFFPVGFILINMIGVDLITGYFAIVTTACVYGRLSFAQLVRLFFFVWLGNLVGSVIYATLMVLGFTMAWHATDASGLSTIVNKIAALKTTHYEQFGSAGALTAFVKAMLCNWMVTLGVVGPMVSRTAFGKVLITWVPIFMFFAMGYEHMVVNMFIMPASMLFGAPISMADFWIGNELPVTLGNFVGGFLFTGMVVASLYYSRKPAEQPVADFAPAPARG